MKVLIISFSLLLSSVRLKADSQSDSASIKSQTEALNKSNHVLSAQVNILITQLNGISEEMTKIKHMLSEKDMSRVSVLENKFIEIEKDKATLDAQTKLDHDEFMSWVRMLFGAIFVAVCGILSQLYLTHIRGKNVDKTLNRLESQTNGLTARLVEVTGKQEYARGLDIGKKEADMTNTLIADAFKQERKDIQKEQ